FRPALSPMPGASSYRPCLWISFFVLLFSLLYSLSLSRNMDSLAFSFQIEIDGNAIVVADGESQDPVQAALGGNAAIFTLRNNELKSGDWILAQNKSEDRSLLPKQVLWFKLGTQSADRAQPVSVTKDGSSYQIKFAGASLTADDGKVFVELMGDGQPNSVVKV
ncbi:hypothetical protein J1614_003543, partial [Plenodomus biglobosus]